MREQTLEMRKGYQLAGGEVRGKDNPEKRDPSLVSGSREAGFWGR